MVDIRLMLYDPRPPAEPSAVTAFGGLPSIDDRFAWPACATCGASMSFLGQISRPDAARLLLVFMCENDPGMCEEWDAEAGGNAALAVATNMLRLAEAPAGGKAARPRHGVRSEQVTAESYQAARAAWAERHPGRQREVLGQWNGTPDWLQSDESPSCDACAKMMTLAAQLETGPDYATEMNFAGGCGYVFDCDCPAGTPKFLWQS